VTMRQNVYKIDKKLRPQFLLSEHTSSKPRFLRSERTPAKRERSDLVIIVDKARAQGASGEYINNGVGVMRD
jgi:hypothetical protein